MQLDGITILDLSQLLPGPYATQVLSDMGAEVIKIEPPGGDPARDMALLEDDAGRLFRALNRGKKSVELDLTDRSQREAFYDLVAEADAVLEQFRPGVAADLGVDYETLQGFNDRLVYCSLSGYGQDGPYSSRVGHDLNYLGLSGFLDMNRTGDGQEPTIPGAPIADMSGGLFAATSILGAVLARELGNGGDYIDISMTDTALSFTQVFGLIALSGQDPHESDSPLLGQYPCYTTYETANGQYVTVGAIEPRFWRTLCEELGRPDLTDAHMAANQRTRARVRKELAAEFARYTVTELEDRFDDKDVMVGPVNTVEEAVEHPQIQAREMIIEGEDGERYIGFPAKTTSDNGAGTDHPALGEHTETVLERTKSDFAR